MFIVFSKVAAVSRVRSPGVFSRALTRPNPAKATSIRSKFFCKCLRLWADTAANYFDALVDQAAMKGKELHVCVSGGETQLEVVNSLRERDRRNVWYYPSAFIGRDDLARASHVDPSVNASVAWVRSGRIPGHCVYATVPPYELERRSDHSDERRRAAVMAEREEIAASPYMRRHLQKNFERIDVAFAGLGLVSAR